MKKDEIKEEIPLSQDEIQKIIDEKIAQFQLRADALTRNEDGRPVKFRIFLGKDNDGKLTGDIKVAFFRQPRMLVASARAMDAVIKQDLYTAGTILWPHMFISEESHPDIRPENNKYQFSLLGSMWDLIDREVPEQVKKN